MVGGWWWTAINNGNNVTRWWWWCGDGQFACDKHSQDFGAKQFEFGVVGGRAAQTSTMITIAMPSAAIAAFTRSTAGSKLISRGWALQQRPQLRHFAIYHLRSSTITSPSSTATTPSVSTCTKCRGHRGGCCCCRGNAMMSMLSTSSSSSSTSLSHQSTSSMMQTQLRTRVSTVYTRALKNRVPRKKLKTKSAVKKRFKLTARGELLRRMAFKQHHSWAKSRRQTGRMGKWIPIEGAMRKKILRLMGNCKR